MNSKIYTLFQSGFQSGHFIRIGENDKLNLYIGKDDHARYCFEFRGNHTPLKVLGSDVISVSQTKTDHDICLRFALEDPDLLEHFCTFCQDLIESTACIDEDNAAYRAICTRYASWKKLFKLSNKKLSEPEIMGLIGELLFLQDQMFPIYGIDQALESWMGPEKTHKDFSLNDSWYEVKTVNAGKESVTISSLEQLDGDLIGFLAVYKLEKMSPSYNGIKLLGVISSILGKINTPVQKEVFMSKLEQFGFDFSPEYDNYVYMLTDFSIYGVKEEFPRLKRTKIPLAISKVQYDIILSDISKYKIGKSLTPWKSTNSESNS